MQIYNKKEHRIFGFFYRWTRAFFNPVRFLSAFPKYGRFFSDWMKYSKMPGAEKIKLLDTFPHLHDRTTTTDFNRHYFYQDTWAFRKIYESKAQHHHDVGSRLDFAGFLSVVTKVTFVDIRPADVGLKNFESIKGDVLKLPFADNSINSLSCLSVLEHIGVGRYDGNLDPYGTKKGCLELARVVSKGGNLYLSITIGKPKLYFNSHRASSIKQIIEYFEGFKLMEFSGIDNDGIFKENLDISKLPEEAEFSEGLFWLQKQ